MTAAYGERRGEGESTWGPPDDEDRAMTALSFPAVDFEEFHRVELPARIAAGNGALAAADVAGVSPIAFKVPDGGAFSYVPGADGVEIWATDVAADTVVELSREAFSDFANELHTCFGLLYAGLAETSRGDYLSFERWEPALRALYHGRPIIDPASMELPDDLARAFSLDDPDDEVRAFLHQTGFVHLRGVFDATEIATLSDEVESARAAARKDDGHSWWATRADGEEVCCRVTYLGRSSDPIAALAGDARLARIAALGVEGLTPETDCLDGLSVVIKHP
jgi:hypothetical protein